MPFVTRNIRDLGGSAPDSTPPATSARLPRVPGFSSCMVTMKKTCNFSANQHDSQGTVGNPITE